MKIGAYAAPRLDGEAAVAQVVSELKALGISEIYLLAKQCSLMTYPSRIAPCVPEAKEWDSFGALTRAATDVGIKVHAWFKLFPVISPVDLIWRGQMGGRRWTGKTDAAYLLDAMDAILEAGADGIWLYLYEALSHRPSYDFSPKYSLPEAERTLLQAGMRERGWL